MAKKYYMNIIKYIIGISLGLISLISLEGLATLGSAFNFESYGIIGWIAQILFIIFTVCLSILSTQKFIQNDNA